MPELQVQTETTPMRVMQPILRKPDATDGKNVWELVRSCRPLDENSIYANIIQADHFRDTCVLAELNGEVVGWIGMPSGSGFFGGHVHKVSKPASKCER